MLSENYLMGRGLVMVFSRPPDATKSLLLVGVSAMRKVSVMCDHV